MYLKLYVWQFHYLAFCTLMGDEVLVGSALSLESTHLCFLVPCGLPWAFILSHQTIVISLHWSPCLTSFPLLHPFLPNEWIFYKQIRWTHQPTILEQIPARGINPLFCSDVTVCSSLNGLCSFMSPSLFSQEYSFWPFKCLVSLQLTCVPEIPSQTCPI